MRLFRRLGEEQKEDLTESWSPAVQGHAHPGQAVMWSPARPSWPFSGKFQDVFSSVENKVDDVSWLPWHSTAGSGWVSGRRRDPLREGPHMTDWGTVTQRMEGTARVNTTKQHSKARSVQGRPTLPKWKEAFLRLLLTLFFAAGLIENREMEKNNSVRVASGGRYS